MKQNFGLFLLALLVISCKDDSTLSYSEKVFEKKINTGCEEFCPSAKLEITLFDNKNRIANCINKKIFEHFKYILSFDDEPYQAVNYDELLTLFLGSYEKLKAEFPNETIGWEIDGNSKISFQNEKFINIRTEYYLYTGGAHGNSSVNSFFFDLKTGKNLSYNKIFTDLNSFSSFAEKKFREKFKIEPNANINSTGFMFENDVFYLPETILFIKNELLLFYNSYEIASYADGVQEVIIPFDEVKPFLTMDYE